MTDIEAAHMPPNTKRGNGWGILARIGAKAAKILATKLQTPSAVVANKTGKISVWDTYKIVKEAAMPYSRKTTRIGKYHAS